jgi:hypothetical protein
MTSSLAELLAASLSFSAVSTAWMKKFAAPLAHPQNGCPRCLASRHLGSSRRAPVVSPLGTWDPQPLDPRPTPAPRASGPTIYQPGPKRGPRPASGETNSPQWALAGWGSAGPGSPTIARARPIPPPKPHFPPARNRAPDPEPSFFRQADLSGLIISSDVPGPPTSVEFNDGARLESALFEMGHRRW